MDVRHPAGVWRSVRAAQPWHELHNQNLLNFSLLPLSPPPSTALHSPRPTNPLRVRVAWKISKEASLKGELSVFIAAMTGLDFWMNQPCVQSNCVRRFHTVMFPSSQNCLLLFTHQSANLCDEHIFTQYNLQNPESDYFELVCPSLLLYPLYCSTPEAQNCFSAP